MHVENGYHVSNLFYWYSSTFNRMVPRDPSCPSAFTALLLDGTEREAEKVSRDQIMQNLVSYGKEGCTELKRNEEWLKGFN